MRFEIDGIYHAYNRGNNNQLIFSDENDYDVFIGYLEKFISPYCKILWWCLMPGHFHLLIYTNGSSVTQRKSGGLMMQQLCYGIKQLLSSYTKYFNARNHRTGNLFQQKTKAKLVDRSDCIYLETVFYYIHQNPWVAGLTCRLEDWQWSSYNHYAGQTTDRLVDPYMASRFFDISLTKLKEEVYQRVAPSKEHLLL